MGEGHRNDFTCLQEVNQQDKDCCLSLPEGKQVSHRSSLSSSTIHA